MQHRVAITGIGLISALGDSPAALHSALCSGQTGVRNARRLYPSYDECQLAAQLVDFEPEKYLKGRPLRPLDRSSQLASSACGLALGNSGWNADTRATNDLAVIVGTMFAGMHNIGDFDRTAITSGPASVSPMAFANTVINAAAGQTAIWHNMRGPNTTVAAGSISGISAVGHGADLIRDIGSRAVLSGGVDELSVESFCGFGRARLLCTNHACAELPIPFEQNRNGFALGEGAGFLVLEELNEAMKRGANVMAEIKGYATAFDPTQGKDSGLAIRTLSRSIRMAVKRSGMTTDEIDFVSASANGSVARDPQEIAALASVFGARADALPITAIKSGIGEALAASGPAQIAVAIETFRTGELPGVIGLNALSPDCSLKGISSTTRTMKARTALINGLGLDGNCCSLVIALPQ